MMAWGLSSNHSGNWKLCTQGASFLQVRYPRWQEKEETNTIQASLSHMVPSPPPLLPAPSSAIHKDTLYLPTHILYLVDIISYSNY